MRMVCMPNGNDALHVHICSNILQALTRCWFLKEHSAHARVVLQLSEFVVGIGMSQAC